MKKFIFIFLCFSLVVSTPSLPEARFLPQRSVLENGLILLTSEQKTLPMVSIKLLIKAGSRYDPAGSEGVSNLTSRLLTYGTIKRTALEIAETLDFMGASLGTRSRRDQMSVSLTVLKKDLQVGLKLLAEILTESTFLPKEIEKQKQFIIASIKARRENPRRIARERFLEALFPQSAYGRPVEGTEDSIVAIERDSLVGFYKRFYRPDRAILAVVGDVSHQEMEQKIARAFQSWAKGPSIKDSPPTVISGPAKFIRISKKLTQANILFGHEGVPRGHPDFYAIRIMNYILGGGGFSSRLMDSIRNERGLAYSVRSRFSSGKYVGTFRVSMQTKNKSAKEAIRIAMEEIRLIRREGVSEEELKAAKDYLVGSFPLRLDTNWRIADFLAFGEFFGLELNFIDRYPELIRQVSQEDILRVAKRHLRPEKLIVVIVANQEKTGFKIK